MKAFLSRHRYGKHRDEQTQHLRSEERGQMGASAEWTRARKGRHLGGFSEQEDIARLRWGRAEP